MKLFPWAKTDERKVVTVNKDPKEDLKKKFVKVCTNGHVSNATYKNKDYIKWAKEALEKNEPYFYTELVDPKKPFGPKKLCGPKYEWRLMEPLTEEEFRRLFDE